MKSHILIPFLIHLVIVFSDSTEVDSNLEELCSESYFDRLITKNRRPEEKQQDFHFYRTVSFNPGFHHYWKVTVERSGVNNTLKPVSIEYKLNHEKLPKYQMYINSTYLHNGNTYYRELKETKNEYKDTDEWLTALGFNALDDQYYGLVENLTIYLMKSVQRSQFVYRNKELFMFNKGTPHMIDSNDEQFGQIPVFDFFGIVCPKEEEDNGLLSFLSEEQMFYLLGVLLFFAIVLPITDLWLIGDRNRFTQEIYDDSRLGSRSTNPSATHSSEDRSIKLSSQRRIIDRRGAK